MDFFTNMKNFITITRLYTGDDNESHFQDIQVPIRDGGGIGGLSESIESRDVIFRTMPGNYDMDWHNTDVCQYVVILSGAVEMEIGSGEKRIFKQGDIVLSEDKTGRGHKSRSVNGQERISIFIRLE